MTPIRTAVAFALAMLVAGIAGAQSIVTGTGSGGGPNVKTFNGAGTPNQSFNAFTPSFTGGVTVAYGDVNGDGVPDIITATATGGSQVTVWNGATLANLSSFYAYSPTFTGGVWVGSGDVNGDGYDDIITGAGSSGNPQVNVFDGKTGSMIKSFFAFNISFTGGVTVAGGDVDGDGLADIIVGTASNGGQVSIFSGATGTLITSFLPFGASYTGGVTVASSDINGDGKAEIIVGTASTTSIVSVFDGATFALVGSFYPYGSLFTAGIRVAAGDVNGDNVPEIITGTGAGGPPNVKAFNATSFTIVSNFMAYPQTFTAGIYVGGYIPKPTATITGSTPICPSASGVISVTLTGRAPWQLTWNDGAVETGITGSSHQRLVGNAATYTITRVGDLNHAYGIAFGSANVTTATAPTITTPPSSPTINSGETATLNVIATGATSYQWYIGDQPVLIPGATSSSYTTTPRSATTSYQVVVSNATCSTNATAHVYVRPPAPAGLDAHGSSTTTVDVTWTPVSGANHYEVWRSGTLVASPTAPSFNDSGLTPSTTYLYRVRTVDNDSIASLDSAPDPATTIVFVDEPIIAGSTEVKAQHIDQIRTAANAFRLAVGLSAATWTNATLTANVIKAVDVTELRTAINEARGSAALPPFSFTNAVLDSTVTIQAVHIEQLRALVR